MKTKLIPYMIVFALIIFLTKSIQANSDTICDANFSYEVYEVIGKPSVIKFTNESSGNPTQFAWDFGDGSISSSKDPIHYFPEDGHFQVHLTVANNTSSDEIIKTVEISVPLSVDFSFKLDTNNIIPNTFIFTGIINGYYDHIIWNFGDKIVQDIVDTIHSYTKQNNDYQVIFTAQYSYNDTSILTKALAKGLTTSEYFNLGGQVYLGDSLMNNPNSQGDTGTAYLFRVNNGHLNLVDTNVFQKLGYYWFDTQLKAHYVVQVSLTENSNHSDDFAPTYVGNTTNWDEAEIINLAQDKFREDVSLIAKNKSKSGDKTLSGYVNDLIESPKEKSVLVYLYNIEQELIDFQWLSFYSDYEFSNLEKGHYLVGADVPGIYSRPQLIYVDDAKENIFKSLNDIQNNNIFPNPARDYTLLTFNNEKDLPSCEIQIYNANGQLIKTVFNPVKKGKNYLHLDLSDVPSGVLFLKSSQSGDKVYKLVHY